MNLTFQVIEINEKDKLGSQKGFINSQITAFIDNVEVGYIKVTLLNQSDFKKLNPNIWHYMTQWGGWYLDFTQDEKKLRESILNYLGRNGAYSQDSDEMKDKVLKDKKPELMKQMKKTKDFFVDKPFVCYSEVYKEFRGQGISDKLYEEASKMVKKQGYILYSDTNQSPLAKKMWERFVKNNKAKFDGKRFIYL